MPCNNFVPDSAYQNLSDKVDRSDLNKIYLQLGGITAVLCTILTKIEESKVLNIDEILTDANAKAWWENHKLHDRLRKEQEEKEERPRNEEEERQKIINEIKALY